MYGVSYMFLNGFCISFLDVSALKIDKFDQIDLAGLLLTQPTAYSYFCIFYLYIKQINFYAAIFSLYLIY